MVVMALIGRGDSGCELYGDRPGPGLVAGPRVTTAGDVDVDTAPVVTNVTLEED